ncbi:MAG TPA: hypothetical protein VH559_01575 [Gemmatimonadaceae bacterium]|jgi:hypothetical protein
MSDPAQSAQVLLKLYELRTEPALRRARAWFAFEFHPTSARDVLSTWLGPGHESAPYRMMTTYWDMAAALVLEGAIPASMFHAANTEHFAVMAKLRPFLAEVRATAQYPDYLMNLERVIALAPDASERLSTIDRYLARQRTLAEAGKQASHLNTQDPARPWSVG